MRILLVVLALMLAFGIAAFAEKQASCNDSSAGPSVSANPSGQAMVDACLSKCLNVSQKQIRDLRSQGMADSDIALACAIATKASKPPGDVVAKYQSSRDWTQVAGMYNLSMADLKSAPVAANPDIEAFNTAFFTQYYSLPRSEIAGLRRQGCSWDDVNVCANAAICTNQPITLIANLRAQGASWTEISSRYGVAKDTIMNPVRLKLVSTTPTTPASTGAGRAQCPAPCGR